jgi:hypothetical protein
MKLKTQMVDALRTKYEGDYKIAHSTLNIYMDKPVAIGEHPQHAEEMDKLITVMADAQDKIDILDIEYPPEVEKEFLTEDGADGDGGVIPHGESVTIQL